MAAGETHSVKRHLDVDADVYDVQIRRLIPDWHGQVIRAVDVLDWTAMAARRGPGP
jgi:hypothetical protein